jgi:transcriptional regulator with XRE-family HTH domain
VARDGSKEVLTALGRTVRTLRLARGLTQERLAEGAGLHTTYISDIERGRRNVGIINVDRIASALHIDLAGLMQAVEAERRP